MKNKKKFASIILAAGKGTRMGGDLPKVLHAVNGRPMIHLVIEAAKNAVGDEIVVVVGYQSEKVKNAVASKYDVVFADQIEQLGTGHAVKCALPYIDKNITDVVILFGDVPLISCSTIQSLIKRHIDECCDITMLTSIIDNPEGYGRIVTCDQGVFLKIVEEKDADHVHKKIKEVNTGICCVSTGFLEHAIKKIGRNNSQNEFYFTDIIEIGHTEGRIIGRFNAPDPAEAFGVNTVEQLNFIEQHASTAAFSGM